MLDLLLFIFLGLVQIALAIWGGIVSAESLPATANKRRHIIGFLSLGVVGLILTSCIGILNFQEGQQAARERENARHVEETMSATLSNVRHDSELSSVQQQDMRGRLEDVEKFLTIMSKSDGKDSGSSKAALEAIKEMVSSQTKSQAINNDQLSVRAIMFANKLRSWSADFQRREQNAFMVNPPQDSTQQQKDAFYQNRTNMSMQMWAQKDYDYRTLFLGEAVYLHDELMARLLVRGDKDLDPSPFPGVPASNGKPDMNKQQIEMALNGSMAGNPIPILADYLEKLARKLSPPK